MLILGIFFYQDLNCILILIVIIDFTISDLQFVFSNLDKNSLLIPFVISRVEALQ